MRTGRATLLQSPYVVTEGEAQRVREVGRFDTTSGQLGEEQLGGDAVEGDQPQGDLEPGGAVGQQDVAEEEGASLGVRRQVVREAFAQRQESGPCLLVGEGGQVVPVDQRGLPAALRDRQDPLGAVAGHREPQRPVGPAEQGQGRLQGVRVREGSGGEGVLVHEHGGRRVVVEVLLTDEVGLLQVGQGEGGAGGAGVGRELPGVLGGARGVPAVRTGLRPAQQLDQLVAAGAHRSAEFLGERAGRSGIAERSVLQVQDESGGVQLVADSRCRGEG